MKEKLFEYTSVYGIALLKYLQLMPTIHEKRFIEQSWARMYNEYDQDPIETIIFLYGNLPMLKSGNRKVETGEFRNNRQRILTKIKESEVREKYAAGHLDEILKEQEEFS